jgi:hypothetical protein
MQRSIQTASTRQTTSSLHTSRSRQIASPRGHMITRALNLIKKSSLCSSGRVGYIDIGMRSWSAPSTYGGRRT